LVIQIPSSVFPAYSSTWVAMFIIIKTISDPHNLAISYFRGHCLEKDPKNDRKLNDRKWSKYMHLDWIYALKYSILRIDQAIDLERRNMICRIVIIVKVI
jgi:hypothetical protein